MTSPEAGGSYVRRPDGTLKRVAHTADATSAPAPEDPPVPAEPPVPGDVKTNGKG